MKYIQPGDFGRGVHVSVQRENVESQHLPKIKTCLTFSPLRNQTTARPSSQSTPHPGQMILQRSRRLDRLTLIQKPASGSGTPTWRQRRGSSRWTNSFNRKKVSSRPKLGGTSAILSRVQRSLPWPSETAKVWRPTSNQRSRNSKYSH